MKNPKGMVGINQIQVSKKIRNHRNSVKNQW